MKWLKKSAYLLLVAGAGALYLTMVDHWHVYAEPLKRLRQYYEQALYGTQAFPGPILSQGQPGQEESPGGADNTDVPPEGENPAKDSPENLSGDPSAEGDGETSVTEEKTGGGSPPVYETVEDSYFLDAVFIGDSRTVGMYEYGGLEETAAFYASKGLTVYKLFDSPIVEVPGQRQKLTVEEALSQNSFKKIYLMVGINEMGTGTVETFAEKYKEVTERLLELQPEAILYVQAILKVTTERSQQGDYITNQGIEERNQAISQLADNQRIFYLDANPEICDDTGGMNPSYTFDGVHLKAQYIDIWKNFLKTHAILRQEEPQEMGVLSE